MKAAEISNLFRIMCLLLCHNHMRHPVNIIDIIGCSFQMIAHYKNRGQMFLSGFYDFTWIFLCMATESYCIPIWFITLKNRIQSLDYKNPFYGTFSMFVYSKINPLLNLKKDTDGTNC